MMGAHQEVSSTSYTIYRGIEFAAAHKRFVFVGVCLVTYAGWAFWLSSPSPPGNAHISLPPPPTTEVHPEKKYDLKSRLEASEQVWQRYVEKRQSRVQGHPENVDPWPGSAVIYYWDYFLPTFTCPHLIERIGGLGDGGKWVCGLNLYEDDPSLQNRPVANSPIPRQSCVIYSLGVAHEYSFEEEVLGRIKGCQVYAYDASVNSMGTNLHSELQSRIQFHKQYVGVNNTETTVTLKAMMERNGHEWIDILKMDIEGGEFTILSQIMDDFKILPFNQLQLEVHGDVDGSNFKDFYRLWERMEHNGLRAFKNEMNHWPCVRRQMRPIYAEYSFININVKGCEFNRLIC